MRLGPGHPLLAIVVLGSAAAFGAAVWGVTLHLLALRTGPLPVAELAILLIPAGLATMSLAFGTGLWLGRRRLANLERGITAAGQPPLATQQDATQQAVGNAAAEQRRIALLLDSVAPGAALFDEAHRLLAWSPGFAALAEVPGTALHPGLSLADLVRLQPPSQMRKLSRHGIEAGIAGAARRQRGDGSLVEDRWVPAAEGGTLLTCRPAEPPCRAAPLSAAELAALCEEEVRTRLPRLQAAIAAADTASARIEAHAIRGVASGFGLTDLAEALLTVEIAARAADLETLVAASASLPQRAEDALRRLSREPA